MQAMQTSLAIVQNPRQFIEDVRQGQGLRPKAGALFVLSIAMYAAYGTILGLNHGSIQSVSTAVKLPVLYLLTAAICFPPLYFLNLFYGFKQSVMQYLVLLLSAMNFSGMLMVSFAPLIIMFLTTTSGDVVSHYQFFKLLNVAVLAVASLFGLRLFYRGMAAFDEGENSGVRRMILRAWVVMFGFIGAQLAWSLRPFFGTPEMPFELVRQRGGNIYVDLMRSVTQLLN